MSDIIDFPYDKGYCEKCVNFQSGLSCKAQYSKTFDIYAYCPIIQDCCNYKEKTDE